MKEEQNMPNGNSAIMVVDDNPENVDLLTKMLNIRGYKVRSFTNSSFALQSAMTTAPGLVLLDIQMPDLDGFSFCRKLKENPETSHVVVIFISALHETQDKVKAFDVGGVDYITKPFQENEVLARVKTHLQLRSMQMHLENLVSDRTAELQESYGVIQRSEVRYRSLFNDALDMIHIVDREGKIIDVNTIELQTMGYTRQEYLGKLLHHIIHPDFLEEFSHVMKQLFSGKGIKNYETAFMTKNGARIDVEVNAVPQMENGKVISVRSIIRNISGRKKKEQEKEELEKQLRQAQKMEAIGTLAGGIAHDFNNILFPIVGYAEMLKTDIPQDSPFQKSINRILHGALRARDLVKQILTFSRQGEQQVKPMKLQPVLKEAFKLLRASIPPTIDIQHHMDLSCGMVNADPTQIHQIIMNLITNAYHAVENTGGKIEVGLKQELLKSGSPLFPDLEPAEYVCLTVADTGTGIKEDVVDMIFDPYFTTKEEDKGTGLGLSVVQGIVKNYNGDIRIDSELGKGTRVNVYLPLMDQSSNKKMVGRTEPIQGGIETIFLIDDEEENLLILKEMLEGLGYRIISSTDSMDALKTFKAAAESFDLAIMDMMMPNMNGEQLARELLSINPAMPIIICSGFSGKINRETVSAMGIKGFLMKPVVRSEMAHMVRKVLDEVKGGQ